MITKIENVQKLRSRFGQSEVVAGRVPEAVGVAVTMLLVDFMVPDMVPRLDCLISNVAYPFSSRLAASSSRCCLA
jgi:hypothetical protein